MTKTSNQLAASCLIGGLALATSVWCHAQTPSKAATIREPVPVAATAALQLSREDQSAFVNSALRIVHIVDAGQIGEMWDSMSPAAWARTSKTELMNFLSELRKLAGPLQSRQPVAVDAFDSNTDAALRGQFVNVRFRSSFAQAPQATEMVSFHKDDDGQWRLTGYALMR